MMDHMATAWKLLFWSSDPFSISGLGIVGDNSGSCSHHNPALVTK